MKLLASEEKNDDDDDDDDTEAPPADLRKSDAGKADSGGISAS
jgi:hypothetical protein